MDELEQLKKSLERLEQQQLKILTELEKNSADKRDFWDKMAAIAPILSGVFIAASALICTYQYNLQQIKLQEAQTIEKFIPHLLGNDKSKRMAILAMKSLVNTDLAAKYAAMFPSEGALSALKTIAKTGDSVDKRIVSKALGETIDELSGDKKGDESSSSKANSEGAVPVDNSSQAAQTLPDSIEDGGESSPVPSPDIKYDTTGSQDRSGAGKDHPAEDKESLDTQKKTDGEVKSYHGEKQHKMSTSSKEEVAPEI